MPATWSRVDTPCMDGVAETRDMIVFTLAVPREGLTISVRDHVVTVEAEEGFHREVELSAEADVEHLHAQLYDGTLELRAPRGQAAPRAVPVQVLR
jgi:HSP20 family molecular chaperone IbpA